MATLVAHLTECGAEVLVADDLPIATDVRRMPEAELSAHADLMIAIGGDGTILYAARLASENGVPVLGVNRGRLGFLADVTPDEMLASIDHVLAGNYSRDTRLQLRATLERADGSRVVADALNDVVLQRVDTGRMVDFETRIGSHYVNTHAGDGLIIATPTGSTAYALSCGGPIVEPQLDALVIVPVCPHTLTDRPIVIPSRESIDIRLLDRDGTRAEIALDGHAVSDILPSDRLVVGAAPARITLIHPPGYDFYGILRSKLFWGRDSRIRYEESED